MKLHIQPADGEPFEQTFDKDSLVVGRSTASDLALADPFLSRFHARLFRQEDKVMVEDLGSRNGTFVNGRMVEGATELKPGDVVKVSGSFISLDHPPDIAVDSSSAALANLGATILRPASELLLDSDTASRLRAVHGEEALRRYAERLELYNEIHEALAGSLSLGELLDLILERAFRHLRPEQGALFLRREEGDFYRAASRFMPGAENNLPLSRSLIEEVCEKQMAALVLDAETDERFQSAHSIIMAGVRSLIAAPLLDEGRSLGMIVLSSKAAMRQFNTDDMEFLVSMASIAALKIRNTALAEEAAERQRLGQELALARRIQVALLPDRLPQVENFSLLARNIPSSGVSGDYYQIVERRGGDECVLMLADVSGKGIGAALITASLEALSIAPIEDERPSDEICTTLSRRLLERSPPEKFATAFLGILAVGSGVLRYTSAGHTPALVLRDGGDVETLAAVGPPLGLVEGVTYEERTLELFPGDTLLLYTDGFTEAENPYEEQYGQERLTAVAAAHLRDELEDLAAAIEADLAKFAQGTPCSDDRTFVLARRLPG